MKPRLLLADDHRIVAEGLRSLLEEEFELTGVAADGREVVQQALESKPDVIVADISMPLLNGIDATAQLRDSGCPAKVVILTMHAEPSYLLRAMRAGARGYVLKHAAAGELIVAIREALAGRIFISPQLRTPAVEEMLDETRTHLRKTLSLTGRQREVLQLLAEGKSAKEIGAILDISPRTVETHKYRMMDDLGLRTTAELIQHAVREGLISP